MPARIMIATGDDLMLVLMSYNVTAAGYSVEALSCGAEVQSRVTEDLPDLLLLDWTLPRISGIQLCRRLRRMWTPEQLPIIIVGPPGDAADRDYALANGACDFLIKPFAMSALLLKIQRLIEQASPSSRLTPLDPAVVTQLALAPVVDPLVATPEEGQS